MLTQKLKNEISRKISSFITKKDYSNDSISWIFTSLYLQDNPDESSCKTLKDHITRKIFVTPFEGAYGQAGIIVTHEGSPPRGTVIVLKDVVLTDLFKTKKFKSIDNFSSSSFSLESLFSDFFNGLSKIISNKDKDI